MLLTEDGSWRTTQPLYVRLLPRAFTTLACVPASAHLLPSRAFLSSIPIHPSTLPPLPFSNGRAGGTPDLRLAVLLCSLLAVFF